MLTCGTPRGGVWAVVPVKRFDRAKARLGPILNHAGRTSLARAMLGDVLEQLARTPELAGTAVVTADADAAALACEFAAAVITDPIESGTNDAVLRGIRALDALGASGLVVVPSDVPCVTTAELRTVLAALACAPVVIAPAARDGGTNLLGLTPIEVMRPAFGPDSFARHLSVAAANGLRPVTLVLDGAGHDIDDATDLAFDARLRVGTRTRACLYHLGITGSNRPADLLVERA